MELSSDAGPEIVEHVIQLAEINSGSSSLQSPQSQNQAPDGNHNSPVLDLLGNEEQYAGILEPLRKAALEGDWRKATRIFDISGHEPRSVLCTPITKERETALHIAVGARQIAFAKEILQLIQPRDLSLQDHNKNTAFSIAVATGNLEIARAMIVMDPDLVKPIEGTYRTPLYKAVELGREKMAWFLYEITDVSSLYQDERTDLFFRSIKTDLYGIAMTLLREFPQELAGSRDSNGETVMHLLAQKHSSKFIQETRFTRNGESESTQALQLLKHILLKPAGVDLRDLVGGPSNALFNAAKLGNFRFLAEIIRAYPYLVHDLDWENRTIFHIAISLRQTSVFDLIHDLSGFHKEVITTYVDYQDNNMLHLAAKYPDPPPPSSMSSAALEMQQELIIFQEVEKLVPPSLREAKNQEGFTPRELFTKHHRSLVQSGAEWMKNTATSCMVVATLIATVVFPAHFTVPGGSDDKTGAPLLLEKTWFRVFAISDAIALSSSSFSILIFLSIATSGFSETDFHISLPRKLMIGMAALFMSIVSMMVTFTSSYFLVYHDGSNYISILSLLFAFVPISLFVLLQYSLLRDIFLLTYRGFPSIKYNN